MFVYRIVKSKWAQALDGEGSRRYGGRWNHPGTSCIYTSESRALALLEYTINTNPDDIPRRLSIVTLQLHEPITSNISTVKISSLPGDWRNSPAPASTKDFGTGLLKENTPALRMPSVIIPEEFNVLLNPVNFVRGSVKVTAVQDLVYDIRIKG